MFRAKGRAVRTEPFACINCFSSSKRHKRCKRSAGLRAQHSHHSAPVKLTTRVVFPFLVPEDTDVYTPFPVGQSVPCAYLLANRTIARIGRWAVLQFAFLLRSPMLSSLKQVCKIVYTGPLLQATSSRNACVRLHGGQATDIFPLTRAPTASPSASQA
jgi:hypothetical protein